MNNQQRTIFDYVTDKSMYVNDSQCYRFVPPFVSYIRVGVPERDIDVENDLRGSNRLLTKCNENKYIPNNVNLVQKFDNNSKYNLNECKK